MARVRTHTNPFNFHQDIPILDLNAVFQNYKDEIDIEIGFGRGVFLREWATLFPERNILGVEVRSQIVDILEDRINKLGLKNTHLFCGSVEQILRTGLETKCLKNIFIFHPDPWLKKNHYKRRVINKAFLDALSQYCLPGAKLYVSTDVDSLWEDIKEHIDQHPQFKAIDDHHFWTTIYKTHWSEFSDKDNRSHNMGTFKLIG